MNNFKVLNLGLDPDILNPHSRSYLRQQEHSRLCQEYHMLILLPGKDYQQKSFYVYSLTANTKIARLFQAWRRAGFIINRYKIDIISSQDQYFVGLLAVWLAKKHKLAVEIQVHGWERLNFIRRRLARYVLSRADSVRTVSLRLVKKLVSDYNIDPLAITEVPIFTEVKNFAEARTDVNIGNLSKQADIIFLSVQRLVAGKRVDLQLKALAWLKEKYPQKSFKLIVVGDGPEKESWIGQAEDLGVADEVEFVGQQTNLNGYYHLADALLLTSDSEGWGLVAVEALAAGLPVIMTDVGLAGEVVINGENGLVVPVGDREALVRALDSFVSNQRLREKIRAGTQTLLSDKLLNQAETDSRYLKSWQLAYVKHKNRQ